MKKPSPSPSLSASSTSTSTSKRKFACVECRQQKSKCDAMERSPLPCTKCTKKNISCVLKRDFKRTYKRARNEVIERTFKQLTENLNDNNLSTTNTTNIKSIWDNNNFTKDKIKRPDFLNEIINTVGVSSSSSPIPSKISNITIPLPEQIEFTKDDLKCTPKSLGEIYMSSDDIAILFNEFAINYHQYLPIVDLKKGPERIYTLSPCLFWVILLTGLRRCDSILTKYHDLNILNQLSHLVKSILAEITISPIIRYTPNENDEPLLNVASVYSVQAFLIYTFWPPLTSSLSADTSWNTIGTAMFQALRVGLNSADFSKEYATANWDLINEQRRTWICCNIVSQIIASSMGFPPYVSFDHSVLLNEIIEISLPLRQMIQIAHFENQIIKTMNSNPLSPSGMVEPHERFPLLHVLTQQLSQLEFQLDNSTTRLDDIRKFLLYVAKVHLQTYYFVISNDHKSTNVFETKRGLVQVYNSAINLLFHTKKMFDKDPNCIKFFPGCFILNIWQSACIITKLIHSSISDIIDCKRGKDAYNVAIHLTLKASILKYDMAYRSSGIMRSIWSLFAIMHKEWLTKEKKRSIKPVISTTSFDDDNEFNLNITVNSRMSVSVFFDCLYILKAKCGMAKLKRESGGVQQDEEDVDVGEVDDDEDDVDGGENGSKETSSTKVLDPELRARKIIESIPLDPNPINAGHSKPNSSMISAATKSITNEPTVIRSPLSAENLTNVYTNLGILEPTSNISSPAQKEKENSIPLDDENANVNSSLKVGSSGNGDVGVNTPISQSNTERSGSHFDNIPPPPSILSHQEQSKETEQQPNEDGDDPNLVSLDEPNLNQRSTSTITTPMVNNTASINTQAADASPNSMIANFDNWDSEMVWKDVDILMNEFAFNPTV
ncbi:hypothetical protein C6P44_002781 [Monosporozyma unispora]|nr:hypothetical protein C6P44_002781 [Kazachstania unispora]